MPVRPDGRPAESDLVQLSDRLAEKNAELLAAVESLDNGKSINMARGDVSSVIGCIRYYAGWADKIEGKTIDIDPKMMHYTRQEPVRPSKVLERDTLLLTSLLYRSVYAVRSFLGTSLCSCLPGRLAQLSPLVTPLS